MAEKAKIVVTVNKDNESLHAWQTRIGPFLVGYVDEVNGTEAVEVPDFVPTRHELIQIVKYWAKERVDNAWFFFVTGQTGSSEWRINLFAERRIDRIAEILGEDEVEKAIDEVFAEFGEKQDKRIWEIFLNGTEEQQEAVQEEFQRAFDEGTGIDERGF